MSARADSERFQRLEAVKLIKYSEIGNGDYSSTAALIRLGMEVKVEAELKEFVESATCSQCGASVD